ncbi:MAG: 3-deoxy-D-manno-octulosonic acid transferase [Acidobacteria bacterium]|nr:3-deoxy-D-manno-octulosonic acid transferase [Acidobacteriota bacterium]
MSKERPTTWLWPLYRTLASAAAGGAAAWRVAAAMTGRHARARELGERLALAPALAGLPRGAMWLHGASVGEVRALAPLAAALRRARGDLDLFVTASTPAGRERATEELRLPAVLAPLDAPGPVGRFLDQLSPRLHVVVETEIWPQRLAALERRGIPAALVSARLSAARLPRYRRLAPLFGPALASFRMVAPAGAADRERLLELGVPAQRLGPEGSLKWDSAPDPPEPAGNAGLARELGLDAGRDWLVLGSAHPGEAGPLLLALAREEPARAAGLVVAPRHLARVGQIAAEIEAAGFAAHLASAGPRPAGDARVLLVDRIGVLPRLYPLAAAAVLGGTFVPVGGHTPLEAAAAGCPLICGPHAEAQIDLVEPLARAGALLRVDDAGGAARALAAWLADPAARARAGAAGRREVLARRGTAEQLARAVLEFAP